jgi:Carbohydrate family 9 binding domain-like
MGPMWRSVFVLALGLTGCQFAVLGIYDDGSPPGVGGGGVVRADGGSDLARPDEPSPPLPDLSPGPDLAPNACGTSAPAPSGSIGAGCIVPAVVKVDGALDDWSGQTFVDLTHTNAAFSKGTWSGVVATDDANSSGSFAVQWDPNYLYVAARIKDDVRGVFPSSPNYGQDDSVQIFLDGNHDRVDGAYNTDDHSIIITADGRGQDAQYGQQAHAVPAGVKLAVANASAAGYTVEVAIPWSVLGNAVAQGGRTIGFDFAISDDDSTSFQVQNRLLIWKFVMPTSGCTTSPTCNTQIFGNLQLLGR